MYWISATFSDYSENKIHQLRSNLFEQLPSEQYTEERDPHITIVPGFTTLSGDKPTQVEIVGEVPSFEITFDAFHLWPSVDEPMVFAIEPARTDELDQLQSSALKWVASNGEVEYDPTPFHTTLFKAGDAGDEDSFSCTDETRAFARSVVGDETGLPLTVTVEDVEVLEWHD